MRRTWAVIGFVVLGLALVGCGSGDDGGSESADDRVTPTTEEHVDEDEWLDGAAEACEDWWDGVQDSTAESDAERSLELALEAGQDFQDGLDDLGEPGDIDGADDLRAAVDAYVEEMDDDLDLVRDGLDEDEVDEVESGTAEASGDLRDAVEDADLDCDIEIDEPATTVPTETVPVDTLLPPSGDATSVLNLDPIEPSVFIPEYGSDLLFDSYADLCFNGDMASCDSLYQQSDVSDSTFSYEGYGATCGGRLDDEIPGQCLANA